MKKLFIVTVFTGCSVFMLQAVVGASANPGATQKILPPDCKFVVLDPITQDIEYLNPSVCEPVPPPPDPQPPVEEPDVPITAGPTANNDPPNAGSGDEGTGSTPLTPEKQPINGVIGNLASAYGALVQKLPQLILWFAWLASWALAIILTAILLIVIATGGAGLSKVIARLQPTRRQAHRRS